MKNTVLNDIKNYAIARLNQEFGFCGAADGDNIAMLNSSDNNGNDIVIKIESKPE